MVKRILPCVFKTALNKKPLFFINSRCKCWCEGRWRRSTWAESETRNNCHRYIWYIDQLFVLPWGTVKRAAKNVQLVMWLFCKTSWLKTNLVTLFVARQVWTTRVWQNPQHCCSTRFAVMLQNNLRVFCCFSHIVSRKVATALAELHQPWARFISF